MGQVAPSVMALSWHHYRSLDFSVINIHLQRILLYCCLLSCLPYSCSTTALPSPPTGLKVSEVTATSVKLSWESASTTPDTSYIVQYKSKHSPGARYKEKTNIGGSTYTVRHLDAFTNYEFRIVTVTKVGRGPPSNPIAVKTGELGQC